MDLCLYTDSVADLSFEAALDLAAEVGCRSIEIAGGGQSSAPHLRLGELLGDRAKRTRLRRRVRYARPAHRGAQLLGLAAPPGPWAGPGADHPGHDPAGGRARRRDRRVDVRHARVTAPGRPRSTGSSTPGPTTPCALLDRQWDDRDPVLAGRWPATPPRPGSATSRSSSIRSTSSSTSRRCVRMREAVGPVIGANMDPSHLFWQQMDPLAAVAALGPAIQHVHLKDTGLQADRVALAGVLDTTPFDDARDRAWVFRTVGRVHDRPGGPRSSRRCGRSATTARCRSRTRIRTSPRSRACAEAAAFILPLIG